jgi:hypothetical protein
MNYSESLVGPHIAEHTTLYLLEPVSIGRE